MFQPNLNDLTCSVIRMSEEADDSTNFDEVFTFYMKSKVPIKYKEFLYHLEEELKLRFYAVDRDESRGKFMSDATVGPQDKMEVGTDGRAVARKGGGETLS